MRRVLVQFSSGRKAAVHSHSAQTMSAVITYSELKKLNVSKTAQIFDVRTPEEVSKGKISNAVNIPISEFEEAFNLDPEMFLKTFHVNKPKLDDQDFVVHCQMGKRGARAADIASSIGYKHVRNYLGGYKEWSEKERSPAESTCQF